MAAPIKGPRRRKEEKKKRKRDEDEEEKIFDSIVSSALGAAMGVEDEYRTPHRGIFTLSKLERERERVREAEEECHRRPSSSFFFSSSYFSFLYIFLLPV